MPDIGHRRHGLGLAWPPPQEHSHKSNHKDHCKQKQEPKETQTQKQREKQPTRWRELQAAFQRPQEYLQASQAHAQLESSHSRAQEGSINEEANEWAAEHTDLDASLLMPATAITAQPATMATTATTGATAAMANTARDGEQYAFDNSPMPSPALPPDHVKSTSTEDPTDPDTTPKASLPSRPNRARGMFKVSSFLNLRGSNFGQMGNSGGSSNVFSSSKSRRGAESGSRSTTPLESPMVDAPLASPWLDSSRGGGSGSGRDKESKTDYFHMNTPVTTPTLLHPSMPSTYSVPPTPVSATVPQDWKQWDQGRDKSSAFLTNAADFTWHRPSFKQIIESLQVAVVSGETVSPTYPGSYYGAPESAEGRPSTLQSVFSSAAMSSRSKLRPSKPAPLPPAMAGPENPIPGRYRSHIMCAIEGILDMQAALDDANRRATEAEESRVRDLVQFAGLSEEWAERQQQYELEVRQLKESMAAMAAATASSPQPVRHRRMFSSLRSEESPGLAGSKPSSKAAPTVLLPARDSGAGAGAGTGGGTQDTFMSRVLAAIEASSRTTKPKSAEEEKASVTVDKRQARPALVCDLEHDRLMSDRIFWELSVAERNKCRQRRRYASRDHRAGHAEPVSENMTWGAAAHTSTTTKTNARYKKKKGEASQESQQSAEPEPEPEVEAKAETKGETKGAAKGADDPSFDASPRQGAPRRPLRSPARPSEIKPVRWSTSRPFSPPGSEDDGEYSCSDSSSSESSGNESKARSGPVTTTRCGDGRRRPAADAETVSDCTAICTSPDGL